MKGKIKYILAVVLIIIISLTIVNIVENKDEDVAKGNLTIWVQSDSYDYFSRAAAEFMELNNKAHIEVIQIYKDTYKRQIEEAIANEHMPDVVQIDSGYVRTLQENYKDLEIKKDKDIISKFIKNYTKSRIEEISDEDNIWGIPFTSRPLILYLRQDVLDQYGYKNEDITTWQSLINMGIDIYSRSGGEIKVLNGVGQDYNDLVSLLVMQGLEAYSDKDEVYKYVSEKLKELEDNNILNKNSKGKFIARISSESAIKEISSIEEECVWTANNVPARINGSNRFYVAEGENLVILKDNERSIKIAKKFAEYLSNNTKDSVEYLIKGDMFLSYLSCYSNKNIEGYIKNFTGKSPLIVMDNIQAKAMALDDYNLYFEIKKEFE